MSPALTANQNGAPYQWLDCDNGNSPIALATNQSYATTANGNFAVEITLGSCIDTSACQNVSTVRAKEIGMSTISIYPNPTKELIHVNFGALQGAVNYTLTSIEGRLIKEQQNVTEKSVTFDLSNESKGIYLLKVDNTSSVNVFRIVRQ